MRFFIYPLAVILGLFALYLTGSQFAAVAVFILVILVGRYSR